MFDIRYCILKPYYIFSGNEATNLRWYIQGTAGWEKIVKKGTPSGDYDSLKTSCTTLNQLQASQLLDYENNKMSAQNELRLKVSVAGTLGILALAKKKNSTPGSGYRYVKTGVVDRLNALFANYYYRQIAHQHEQYKNFIYLWQNFPTYILDPVAGLKEYSIKEQIDDLFISYKSLDSSVLGMRFKSFLERITDKEIYSPAVKFFFDTYADGSEQEKKDSLNPQLISKAVKEGFPIHCLNDKQVGKYYMQLKIEEAAAWAKQQKEEIKLSAEKPNDLLKKEKIDDNLIEEKNKNLDENYIKDCLEKDDKIIREESFIMLLINNKYFNYLFQYYVEKNINIETKGGETFEVLNWLIKQKHYNVVFEIARSFPVPLSADHLTSEVQNVLLDCAFTSKDEAAIDIILELKHADIAISFDYLQKNEHYKRIFWLLNFRKIELSSMTPRTQVELLIIAMHNANDKLFNKIFQSKNIYSEKSQKYFMAEFNKKIKEQIKDLFFLKALIKKGENFKDKINIQLLVLDCLLEEKCYENFYKIFDYFDIKLIEQKLKSDLGFDLFEYGVDKHKEKIDKIMECKSFVTKDFINLLIKKDHHYTYAVTKYFVLKQFKIEGLLFCNFLIMYQYYDFFMKLIKDSVIECTMIPIEDWEVHERLSKCLRDKECKSIISKIMKKTSGVTDDKTIEKMSAMFLHSRLDDSKEASLMVKSLAKLSLEYLLEFRMVIMDDIVMLLMMIMNSNYYSDNQKWQKMKKVIDCSSNSVMIATCIVNEAQKNNSNYLYFLLRLISYCCGQCVGEEEKEDARKTASKLLMTMINDCKDIPTVMKIVNNTEDSEDKHNSWDFLQKRRSYYRLSTFITYTCNNGIQASTAWIEIMRTAQHRIMILANSAMVLEEDKSVIKFLGKQTCATLTAFLNGSDNLVEKYKSLCLHKKGKTTPAIKK